MGSNLIQNINLALGYDETLNFDSVRFLKEITSGFGADEIKAMMSPHALKVLQQATKAAEAAAQPSKKPRKNKIDTTELVDIDQQPYDYDY